MKALLDIFAKIISLVFYPLFIPTYGIALFCYVSSTQMEIAPPLLWMAMAVSGTLLFTCVLPMLSIWMLMRRGKVQDIQIAKAEERTLPYIYSAIGFAFWTYFMMFVLQSPIFLSMVCLGTTIAIGIVAVINRWWKISAHLTGIGALFGGLMSYFLYMVITPSWFILGICFILSFIVMTARLRLNAHTDAQVAAGWLLGLICSFIPYSIIHYVA